jgi:hypothetical protein
VVKGLSGFRRGVAGFRGFCANWIETQKHKKNGAGQDAPRRHGP